MAYEGLTQKYGCEKKGARSIIGKMESYSQLLTVEKYVILGVGLETRLLSFSYKVARKMRTKRHGVSIKRIFRPLCLLYPEIHFVSSGKKKMGTEQHAIFSSRKKQKIYERFPIYLFNLPHPKFFTLCSIVLFRITFWYRKNNPFCPPNKQKILTTTYSLRDHYLDQYPVFDLDHRISQQLFHRLFNNFFKLFKSSSKNQITKTKIRMVQIKFSWVNFFDFEGFWGLWVHFQDYCHSQINLFPYHRAEFFKDFSVFLR